LALQGRFDEAFPEIERARQLDPLSLIIAADYGAILYFSRQHDRAIEQFRAVSDMEPNFPRAHMISFAYVQKGMYGEAIRDIELCLRWTFLDHLGHGSARHFPRTLAPLGFGFITVHDTIVLICLADRPQ
jgi:tetratricopeptide (TPR) repeat protein